MEVYNEAKTEILTSYDLTKGYLKDDYLETTVPEVQAVEEQSHYEVIAEYPNGGKDLEKVIDVEGVEYQPEHTIQTPITVYVPYTDEELAQQEIATKSERLAELTNDFAQVEAGLVIDDIDDRREEFRTLLNEIRVLQGKEPRQIAE